MLQFGVWWYRYNKINYVVFSLLFKLYARDFNTVASPTKPPRMITGRRTRPRSRNTVIQKSKLDLKLVKKKENRSQVRRSVQFVWGTVKEVGDIILPHDTANAVVQHVVQALVQGFLLAEEDGPVVRQYPWTSTRGRIRVCRSAEDGTHDALNGRGWHACGEDLRLPGDDVGFCATIKTHMR